MDPGKSDADAAGSERDSGSDPFVPSPTHWQVFLSFSGADVEKEFADLIYQALVDAGIRVLKMDHGELDAGGQLVNKIEHCKISIPILSNNYVRSRRCLQELTWMLECRERRRDQVIEPIFYDISRYDLRAGTHYRIKKELLEAAGISADSISQHLNSWEHHIPQQWRDALACIGRQRGWDLRHHAFRNQGHVIEHVVAWTSGKLRGKSYLLVTDSLVGIDDHIEAMTGLLDLDAGGVKAIGIYGSAGIGKTTLVKAAYNFIVDCFEDASFLSVLEERSRQPRDLEVLQAQLLSDLSTWRGKVADVHKGSRELSEWLGGKNVLIVLDGVVDVDQFKALTRSGWLGPGSRIIVTGRDRHVQERCMLDSHYEVTEMHPHNAFLLFCKHAFMQDSPPDEFARIAWEIAKVAGGNPLSIEVTGSSLYGKTKPAWEATLEQLRKAPYKGMFNSNLDNIGKEDRNIFLDIACFFVGMDVRLAMYMWHYDDVPPHSRIRTLQERSLIQIGDDNKLWMPNHLRVLGREIASRGYELGPRTRFWGEDALDLINRNCGSYYGPGGRENPSYPPPASWYVEAICLDYGNGSGEHVISSNQLENREMLRFFDVTDASLSGDILRHLRSLRWFGWHGNAIPNISSLTYPKNLSVLDLSKSSVNVTWDGWSPNMEVWRLKALNLTSCRQLARIPNFSSFPHIETLILRDCTALSAIDTSIGLLEKLKSLDLRNCASLEKLPEEIGLLSGLENLHVDGCAVQKIPILEGMRKLRTLSAKSCRLLTQIPQSIGALVGLKELLLDDCEALTKLPTSIGELNSLEVLSLSHSKVSELPDSFRKSSNLKVLNIDHCPIRTWEAGET